MPAPARLSSRFLARLIDTVILIAIEWLLAALVAGPTSPGDFSHAGKVLMSALVFILYFAYEGAMTAGRGQTLGKMALRIRVALIEDGAVPGRAGWTRAAVYALPGVLLSIVIGPIFWLLNCVWCTWDRPFRQCLHDKAAKTVVVSAV